MFFGLFGKKKVTSVAFNLKVKKQPTEAVQNAILEGVDWINERIEKDDFTEIELDNKGGYAIIRRLLRNENPEDPLSLIGSISISVFDGEKPHRPRFELDLAAEYDPGEEEEDKFADEQFYLEDGTFKQAISTFNKVQKWCDKFS